MIEQLLFWTCLVAVVAGALGAATVRNLIHAGLLLGISLVGVAGLYLFLHAEYLACIQLIVYVGGILVLVIFATLFSADIMGERQRGVWWQQVLGGFAAVLAAAVSVRLAQVVLIGHGPGLTTSATTIAPDHLGGGGIGALLLGDWLVPFLAAGLLLTVVLIAAVAIVLRHQAARPASNGGDVRKPSSSSSASP